MERNQERKVCLAGDPGVQGLGRNEEATMLFTGFFNQWDT